MEKNCKHFGLGWSVLNCFNEINEIEMELDSQVEKLHHHPNDDFQVSTSYHRMLDKARMVEKINQDMCTSLSMLFEAVHTQNKHLTEMQQTINKLDNENNCLENACARTKNK